MNKKLSPFVIAPIAFLLAMQGASAMTLGDLQVKSYIGQRFKGDIPYRLGANERLLEDCHAIRQISGDVNYLGSASLQVIPYGDGNSGVIRITSQRPSDEPIMGFALQVQCENIDLTREFTVFLDPAPIVDAPVVSDKTKTLPLNTSIEAKKAQMTTVVKKDTSLEQIARRYYSLGSTQYERYLQKLKRSNPDFTADEVIVAGTELHVPPRPKAKPKAVNLNAAPPQLAANPPQLANEQGLLRLEGAERQVSVPNSKVNPDAYVKELEAKVAQLTELRQKLQMEIDALDQRLALNAAISAQQTGLASGMASAVATVAPKPVQTAAAIAKPAESTVKRSVDNGMTWQWPMVGFLAFVGGGVWWWLRRRTEQDGFDSVASHSVLSVLKTNYSPRHAAPTELSLIQQANSAIQVSDAETSSLEQAQYYLAHGDTFRALELLQQLLDADPQDVERWLMLFRVYRQQGMKSDYIRLAQQFRAQDPKPADDDWELVRSIGYKLAPEVELFARGDSTHVAAAAEKQQEQPVDLAIENLTMATQAASIGKEPDNINLLEAFQAKPAMVKPSTAQKIAPPLAGDETINVPELSVMNHQEDISSLEQFEFDVKELEFDDEKEKANKN
ncbi:hypothetical protein NT239_13350 [Chitinibacter sp. SCUT-21]|uniref:type IV pilus assembly protein FimV n=1 Tax=Chitinibacter sp. SCUT-21 TaxID=2970891 RepID=UPI0035A6535C